MKQTGTFYTLTNNESGTEVKKPFPNIFLYFSQKGVRKLTTQTNASGKFDFDLPLGNYNVTMSVGANSSVFTLAGGSEFSLTSSSKVSSFEQWAMTPVYLKPEENPLVIRLNELAQTAVNAATEAKAIQDAMNNSAKSYLSTTNTVADRNNILHSGLKVVADSLVVGENGFAGNAISTGVSITKVSDRLNNSCGFAINNHETEYLRYSYCVFMKSGVDGYAGRIEWTHGPGNDIVFSDVNPENGIRKRVVWHSRNTTVDSNGNIKRASPIIKLFNDHIESNDSFKEKPTFKKLGTGVYKISNTLGLAKEGWYIETPKDKNGLPYFMVDWEQDEESQDVIIRVFKKKLDLETLDFVNGYPVDIGQDQRWIDLRFHEEQEDDDEELLTQPDNLDESAH